MLQGAVWTAWVLTRFVLVIERFKWWKKEEADFEENDGQVSAARLGAGKR